MKITSLLLLALTATTLFLSAAEPLPEAPALKADGIIANAIREGGWSVEVRDAKTLTDANWKQIEALPEVKRFSAGGEAFDDAALVRLAKITTLESLFFNGPAITDAGLAALAKMPNLKRFGVDHSTKITGSGLSALRASPQLEALHFGGCIIGDQGVETLAQLTSLRDVALDHTRITRASFPLLAKLPHLERLEITPNWDPKPYTSADFAALAPMKSLSTLEVHDMVLPWDGGLAQLKALPYLKTLNLFWCYLAPEDRTKLEAGLPGVKIDIRNPAGEDRLKQFNERVEQLRKEK